MSADAADWSDWPGYALLDDLLPTLEAWAAQGRRVALATLIDVAGSAPRRAGSEMAVDDRGECAGYVSGGCVEAAVAAEALGVLRDGAPRLLDYGSGSPVLDVRLSCGGRIRILLRPIAELARHVGLLRRAREERRCLCVVTELDSGLMRYEACEPHEDRLEAGAYFKCHRPPLRLVLVGADPVVLSLLQLASALGIETVLLRPHGPERVPAAFAPQRYDRRRLEVALDALALDETTAVYTLSHDVETDHQVLSRALRSPAFCVGALGSRRKAEARLARLRGEGFDAAALARLHTPAGLPIRAHTPQQIALSILGQFVAERPC